MCHTKDDTWFVVAESIRTSPTVADGISKHSYNYLSVCPSIPPIRVL